MKNGMTYKQVSAITDKYIDENPTEWHYAMPDLIWSAVAKACTAPEKKKKVNWIVDNEVSGFGVDVVVGHKNFPIDFSCLRPLLPRDIFLRRV